MKIVIDDHEEDEIDMEEDSMFLLECLEDAEFEDELFGEEDDEEWPWNS